MKRDMELVRAILLAIENAPENLTSNPQIEGYEPTTIELHMRLLREAGFVQAAFADYRAGVRITHGAALTWSGHDFLEDVRDPKIWASTKEGANKVGSWSLTLLGELAKGFAKQKAIELGLPLA